MMDLKELVAKLHEAGVKKSAGETVLNTYSDTPRLSSLLIKNNSNRAQSSWKTAQYVIAKYDETDASLNDLLEGWKYVVGPHRNQYLILEEEPNKWKFFNSNCIELSTLPILNLENQQNSRSPYRQFITAIKTKPFLLLAGISGTGKSRIVRELARSCWAKDSGEYKALKPRNFEMVQVKPNWHDSSELIGYVSRINGEKYVVGPFLKFMVRAMQEPDVPYFLCLDEMNLAPVEQYFAEYLSVIESRRVIDGKVMTDPIVDYEDCDAYHSLMAQLFPYDDDERKRYLKREGGKRLTIPPNLIVVGTVNMDETTFSFSRKVLDRAMTIEMNEVDLRGGLDSRYEPIPQQSKETLIGTAVEGVDVYESHKVVCDQCIRYLERINEVLEGTPFKVAYRTRNELLLYVVNNLPYAEEGGQSTEEIICRALDEITSMKILSRIEGDGSKVSETFLDNLSSAIIADLGQGGTQSVDQEEEAPLSGDGLISIAKIREMKKKLKDTGYTSFWG